MHATRFPIGFFAAIIALCSAQMAQSQYAQPAYVAPPTQEVAIVEAATGVLNEIMSVPNQGIPNRPVRAMPRASPLFREC